MAGRMDVVDFNQAARNSGVYKQSRFNNESREVDIMGRLHCDMFFQDRYMLNEVATKKS